MVNLLEHLIQHPHLLVAAGGITAAVLLGAGRWLYGITSKGRAPQDPENSKTRPDTVPAAPKTVNRRSSISPDVLSTLAKPLGRATQDADVTVFAPSVAPPGDEVLVQVFVHTPDQQMLAQAAKRIEPAAVSVASNPLELPLRPGDSIKVTLEGGAATAAEPVQSAKWNGRWVCFYFMLQLPPARAERTLTSKLRVFVNGTPAGIVVFRIKVMPNAPDLLPSVASQEARALRRHFLSYASEDRVAVLKAAQTMSALKLEFFQDLLRLSPGERWQQRLFMEIEKCDIFLLFWSRHAQQSEWVIREAEHALRCSRSAPADRPIEIVPVLLEGPPPPLPPASLSEIHFNDPIRNVIFAEENRLPPPEQLAGAPSPPSLLLCIGPVTRALQPGLRIEPHMLGAAGAGLAKGPVAETVLSPDGSGALGLRNLSLRSWHAQPPAGATIDVRPGHAVRLAGGLVIDFGGIKGVVRTM
jgi:TIR domain